MARFESTGKLVVSFWYTGLARNVWQACDAHRILVCTDNIKHQEIMELGNTVLMIG